MADRRTELTELATALGMLGLERLDDVVAVPPGELVGVSADQLAPVRDAITRDTGDATVALAAMANGRAFAAAADGLRGRRPARIEWKGPHRPPGYDLLPADLRIDHVYLVSCKYQSQVLCNVSPAHLFDRLLQVRSGAPAMDWYALVAPAEHRALWAAVRADVGGGLPETADRLDPEQRRLVARHCTRRWPDAVAPAYLAMCRAVSEATAARWSAAAPTLRQRQELLWRLLRLSDCPYFVLGTAGGRSLRLRIATPWDWRQQFRLLDFTVAASAARQPQVDWAAEVLDRSTGEHQAVRGHVEVRWSHGRFCGMPEAKVYLDTPHGEVPGYYALAGDATGRPPRLPHRPPSLAAAPAAVATLPLWPPGDPVACPGPGGLDVSPGADRTGAGTPPTARCTIPGPRTHPGPHRATAESEDT